MVPRSIKNPVPDVLEDAHPLIREGEAFEEEKEREDCEKQMGGEARGSAEERHVFWPEED